MRTLFMGLPLLIALSGCETMSVGASSKGTVPKMAPGANIPRWEHLCMAGGSRSAYTDFLNEAGDQGWEMVGVSESTVCFKRPKVAPATPQAAPSGTQAAPAATSSF